MVSRVRYEAQPGLQARRNAIIAKAYAKGLTLTEIAAVAGLTPERVRQIVSVFNSIQRDMAQ